ncbi:hypothetical protein GCM10023083_64260 [Streptomyces phyllanthi]
MRNLLQAWAKNAEFVEPGRRASGSRTAVGVAALSGRGARRPRPHGIGSPRSGRVERGVPVSEPGTLSVRANVTVHILAPWNSAAGGMAVEGAQDAYQACSEVDACGCGLLCAPESGVNTPVRQE